MNKAKAILAISSKNYSSWSLRGWLMCKFAGLAFDERPNQYRPERGFTKCHPKPQSLVRKGYRELPGCALHFAGYVRGVLRPHDHKPQ